MAKQQKPTMFIEHTTAPIIRCKANKDFTLLGEEIKAGEAFFMVRSSSNDGKYHLVRWSDRQAWKCSCGAGYKHHAHVAAANNWIKVNVVQAKAASKIVKFPVANKTTQTNVKTSEQVTGSSSVNQVVVEKLLEAS